MKKAFTVARWEFFEKVKSKTFIISLFLTPAIIIAFSVLPTLMATGESDTTKAIGILDLTQEYFSDFKDEIEVYKLKSSIPAYAILNNFKPGLTADSLIKSADAMVIENKLDGYILIRQNGADSVKVEFRTKSIGNFQDIARFEEAFNNLRIKRKLVAENVSPQIIEFIKQRINVNQVKIERPGEEGKGGFEMVFFSSIIFILLLMMMIIYSGQMLVRSMLEEKSNRLIEILISSCTPQDLLFGKVFGLSTLGFTQVLVWLLIGFSLIGAAIVPISSFDNIHLILLYFILGFIFYTTLFVGIGSVASTEQEAQQITSYLSLLLVLPSIFIISTLQNPDSSLVKIFSYIPFTLPSVMILRVNVSPIPLWEIAVTVLIMIFSITLTIKISAKIFRFGILYYGKMPTLAEIKVWLKD
ncbi:ABC transporter permease [Ignavibacterium sp.]|jgi:ABC-2 type transport system permease protein|uniref:ABC transporter permease n=1 Tax=Ignavibacterium sp. TaxID=2651167 RepID=UPI0025C64C88|nr:ABC transporter permease [Ignavibacterium sp.]